MNDIIHHLHRVIVSATAATTVVVAAAFCYFAAVVVVDAYSTSTSTTRTFSTSTATKPSFLTPSSFAFASPSTLLSEEALQQQQQPAAEARGGNFYYPEQQQEQQQQQDSFFPPPPPGASTFSSSSPGFGVVEDNYGYNTNDEWSLPSYYSTGTGAGGVYKYIEEQQQQQLQQRQQQLVQQPPASSVPFSNTDYSFGEPNTPISAAATTASAGAVADDGRSYRASTSTSGMPSPSSSMPATYYGTASTLLSEEKEVQGVAAAATTSNNHAKSTVIMAKEYLLELLKSAPPREPGNYDSKDDDTLSSPVLQQFMHQLHNHYTSQNIDARYITPSAFTNGVWEEIRPPALKGRMGFTYNRITGRADPRYKIGTLSLNQIPRARDIVCSVQKVVQRIEQYDEDIGININIIPDQFRDAVMSNPSQLRTNHIDTHFTIDMSDIKLEGVLRTEGYAYPSQTIPNRYDMWFVNGRIFAKSDQDNSHWDDIFGGSLLHSSSNNGGDGTLQQEQQQERLPTRKRRTRKRDMLKRQFKSVVDRYYAASEAEGNSNSNDNGSSAENESDSLLPPPGGRQEQQQQLIEDVELAYSLGKPIVTYQDVLYLDDDVRISIGNRGAIMILERSTS